MAETISKRQREETHFENSEEDPKRQKSYNQILAILEDEEDESNQDLSSILTTLQQELSCDSTRFDPLPGPTSEADPEYPTENSSTSDYCSPASSHGASKVNIEDEEREMVMRRLLEASDDELGLPHNGSGGGGGDDGINGGDYAFNFSDGLWEIEDEAANYSLLLQSELFMY